MLTLPQINKIIIRAKNSISAFGLLVIRDYKKKGFSDYTSTWLEYNLLLTAILGDLEFNYENLEYQNLILELEGINNSLNCSGSSVNEAYSTVDSENINSENELIMTFLSLADVNENSYLGKAGYSVVVSDDETGLVFDASRFSIDGGSATGNFHPSVI